MIKKILCLIPLLLISGCSKVKVFYNVGYEFDTNEMLYKVMVYHEDFYTYDTYKVDPKKFYKVEVYDTIIKDNKVIDNEFYLSTKELFVYYRR